MERRREARVDVEQPARLTVLGKSTCAMPAAIANVSNWGMRAVLPEPVAAGEAVRVDAGESLYLGEVCYCRPERGQYAVGIAIEQALAMTEELAELRDAILCGR